MDTAGVAYVHTHTHGCTHMHTHTHTCMHTHTHTHARTHTYNKIFSSRKQKKETLQFATTCLDFEDLVLSQRDDDRMT